MDAPILPEEEGRNVTIWLQSVLHRLKTRPSFHFPRNFQLLLGKNSYGLVSELRTKTTAELDNNKYTL
jgi:hypothetical protein